MAHRVTIMLDNELAKKIRIKQAKMIKDSSKSVSFSKMINLVVEKGLSCKN